MLFMNTRIISIFLISTFLVQNFAFAKKKEDRKLAKQIRTDITYLASDDLEGRRTSTDGERKAADYIEKRYKEMGIIPYNGKYRYPFQFVYGKEIAKSTQIRINNVDVKVSDEAFPMPFSATKNVKGTSLKDVMEQGNIWLVALYTDEEQAKNPHFEWEKLMSEKAKDAESKGASGVLFYDSYGSKYSPVFNTTSDYDQIGIPVVFVKHETYDKLIKNTIDKGAIAINLNIEINKAERNGTNLAAYIDNKAKYTVVLGAHYDHLGYGQDGNSLYANAKKEHKIHHGADDNASGTAALLSEANRIKKNKKLHNYNYLFVNFSGEELGLYGSKAFVKDQKLDSIKIAYMINMDMIGRLNDSTHSLTLGGVGTSPAWPQVVDMAGPDFKLTIDSTGVGPSDHTSFNNAGIPVLFFFTGSHKDYHKPSDQADLINYPGEVKVLNYVNNVVVKMDDQNSKPKYLVTKAPSMGKSSFKVTLGIMPDYTFQDGGVRIDGVSDGRPASKAGLLTGDVIIQLGDYKIQGIHAYMDALGKFSSGDKTNVTITRGGKEMVLPIELAEK